MSNKHIYIGSRVVKIIVDDPNDKDGLIITFEDGSKGVLKKKLYQLISKDVKGNGDTISEVANAYIGMKIVKELADYGYERFQIEGIAAAVGNLVHNLTEIKIGEKFGVAGSNNIKLSDIL